MTSNSIAGFDLAGGSACCFNPGEVVDVFQGSVSRANYTRVSVKADSSGRVTFTQGDPQHGLQLAFAYPLGGTTFIAAGEASGKQLSSATVQVVQKVNLTSSSWTAGEEALISGFGPGTNAQVCLNQPAHTTGCDTLLGTAVVDSTGKVPFPITKPSTGNYVVVVNVNGTSFASALSSS